MLLFRTFTHVSKISSINSHNNGTFPPTPVRLHCWPITDQIDTDKYPKLMAKFGVNGLPTLILFKEGKELQRIEGVLPAEQLMQQLRYFLAGAAAGSGEASGQPEGDACSPPRPQDACAPPPRDACAPPQE